MIISMKNLERLSIAEMEEFLRGSRKLELATECQEAVYQFLEGLLASQQYRKLKKRERGIVRRFGAKITGLSRAQVTRLIGRWKRHRHIEKRLAQRPRFARRYTAEDVALLAETDTAHENLSGPAIRHILHREFIVYNKGSTNDWLRFRFHIFTTCATRSATAGVVCGCNIRARGRYRSESGASQIRKVGLVTCGWTLCIKDNTTASREFFTSMLWIQ